MAEGDGVYHNQFAVEVDGGDDVADAVAARHDLLNLGSIGDLKGLYLFQANDLEKRFYNYKLLRLI